MRKILHNALRTPDGTVLVSRSVHDYKTYTDANGKRYMIDGGNEYVRSSSNGDEEFLTLYSDDPHEELREVLTWGTYGKSGKEPLKRVLIKELSDNHIKAILDNCDYIGVYKDILFNEIKYRK